MPANCPSNQNPSQFRETHQLLCKTAERWSGGAEPALTYKSKTRIWWCDCGIYIIFGVCILQNAFFVESTGKNVPIKSFTGSPIFSYHGALPLQLQEFGSYSIPGAIELCFPLSGVKRLRLKIYLCKSAQTLGK